MANQFPIVPNVPNWTSSENQGTGLEIADLSKTGKKDLIIFQIVAQKPMNKGLYTVGQND